jgi:hypothetical protein
LFLQVLVDISFGELIKILPLVPKTVMLPIVLLIVVQQQIIPLIPLGMQESMELLIVMIMKQDTNRITMGNYGVVPHTT